MPTRQNVIHKMVILLLLMGGSLTFSRPIEKLSSANGKLNHPVIFVHGWNSNMTDQFGVLPEPLGGGFIPTQKMYTFNTHAEVTRPGKTHWTGWGISYRFKTGVSINLWMDTEAGGWELIGTTSTHWFPSVDCDDIDWDRKNCTPTVRDNLVVTEKTDGNGVELIEVHYAGYHCTSDHWYDDTNCFYKSVSKQELFIEMEDELQSIEEKNQKNHGAQILSNLDIGDAEYIRYSVPKAELNDLDRVYRYMPNYAPYILAKEFELNETDEINENGLYFFNSKRTLDFDINDPSLCSQLVYEDLALGTVGPVTNASGVANDNYISVQVQVEASCEGITQIDLPSTDIELKLYDPHGACNTDDIRNSVTIDPVTQNISFFGASGF